MYDKTNDGDEEGTNDEETGSTNDGDEEGTNDEEEKSK